MQGRCGHTIELKLAVYGLFSQLQLQYSGLPRKAQNHMYTAQNHRMAMNNFICKLFIATLKS